ncbi:hypothetical protein PHLGIDRAFT_36607 [Phlebiopsis gigantea 11061_1 CR5-6]|uniref:MARVEL domain-containing protein n=1 Tax=Phlebiopsis gigantea (strain 11061_1 CR5-6) TaxID=745531 RepID=A0A0C3PH11_PHLG1|nr:hypothetical protein PHLGIDRAFT_36607 [Phlebiopsis gigantea 11061_1 CR5-6]
MRKTSYVIAFFAVVATFTLNVVSLRRPDWLVVNMEGLGTKSTYQFGLTRVCERFVIPMPGPSDGSKIEYSNYECRPFPAREADHCEKENRDFCIAWTTAGYISELGAGFAVVSALALVFGVTTHSRRRRIWRAVAVLVGLHAACLIATFALVTDAYTNSTYPLFDRSRPNVAYVLGTLAWILAVFATFGVAITGMAANRGHRWAAGNRHYTPIAG